MIREKRKLEPDVEKGITDLVTVYVQDIIGRRKKDKPDKFDDYVDTAKGGACALGKKPKINEQLWPNSKIIFVVSF